MNHLCQGVLILGLLEIYCGHAVAADGEVPLSHTDTFSMRDIQLGGTPWTYTSSPTELKLTDRPITLASQSTGRRHGFAHLDALVPGGIGFAAVQHQATASPMESREHGMQWAIALINLKEGNSSDWITLPDNLSAKAISPDGKIMAAAPAARLGDRPVELDLVALGAGDPKIQAAFIPYEAENDHTRQVGWVRFIDETHLLTLNDARGAQERLIFWNYHDSAFHAVWSLDLRHHFGGDPLLTPDLKYVLVMDGKGSYFVEAATGRTAAAMLDPTAGSWYANQSLILAISPSGKLLARSTDTRVRIISLGQDCKMLCDIPRPPGENGASSAGEPSIIWAGNDYLLMDNRYLIDVNKKMIIWTYGGLAAVRRRDQSDLFCAGDQLWQMRSAGSGTILSPLDIPSDEVKKTVANLDINEVMAVRPGVKITLDIDIPNGRFAGSVRTHFESELLKHKMILADNQPLKLRVTMGMSQSRSVEYQSVERPYMQGESADVANREITVSYEFEGRALWQTTLYSDEPFIVEIKPGQSLGGAIFDRQAADLRQIFNLELPEYVPKYRNPPGFGETLINEQEQRRGS